MLASVRQVYLIFNIFNMSIYIGKSELLHWDIADNYKHIIGQSNTIL